MSLPTPTQFYHKNTGNIASLQPNMSFNSSSNFDEFQWVVNMRRELVEDLEDGGETPVVCIFNVPKSLLCSNPDAYIPQFLSLGPYHYWRLELHEMERCKLAAAKRMQKQLQSHNFVNLVEQLIELEPKIRACYHKYLTFNGETLAWIMAMDASFLLEFLQVYTLKEAKKRLRRVSSKISHLLDYSKSKSTHNSILKDVMMLENQIPLFVLRKVLEFEFQSLESADGMLYCMLLGLCKELSPFKAVENLSQTEVLEHAHLLDILYHFIVPNMGESPVEIIDEEEVESHTATNQGNNQRSPIDSSYAKQLVIEIWNFLSSLNIRPINFLNKLVESVGLILKFPGFGASSARPTAVSEPQNEPPLVEEITIPSVTQLAKSGFRILPTSGNISAINFDMKTVTLYLPTIYLDVNSEVILRNLVAYEASNAKGAMVFTRYTELMNGIIDTKEDVKLLRESGIIVNCLKSDEEVADLWNGMNKSLRLTKVPFLDRVIEDVNECYGCQWKSKVGKFIKKYVFDSWQLLTMLATILLLLLTTLQSFCSVYDCIGILHVRTSN